MAPLSGLRWPSYQDPPGSRVLPWGAWPSVPARSDRSAPWAGLSSAGQAKLVALPDGFALVVALLWCSYRHDGLLKESYGQQATRVIAC